MTHQEIRGKFIEFFKSKGHTVVPSSSLLPTDSSVLFTTAGMQQFKPYYTGVGDAMKDFGSLNTVSIQKSMRTSDIDSVGDESHLTFFEMLGNFSFGGYWKKEAIQYAHEFITKEMGLKIDYVSVFGGSGEGSIGRTKSDADNGISGEGDVPADKESEQIWKEIDSNLEVKYAGRADNFWGPTGTEGPCGPTTEIYVNGLEVWNIVFNEYYQSADGQLEKLKIQGIDTGMGLERLAMVVQRKQNIFETDLFEPLIEKIRESIPNINSKSERIVADHLRASLFLIADGVLPSNKEQGYILRRLVRRAVTHLNILDMSFSSKDLESIASFTIETYKNYQELKNENVLKELSLEIRKFRKTIENGFKEFEDRFTGGKFSGKDAYYLHESQGFPFLVTEDLIKMRDPGFDFNKLKGEYGEAAQKHQEISRAGAEKKFGGHGIKEGDLTAGSTEEMKKVARLHTATHIIVVSLQKVLGQKLPQAGADITVERLRFDFTFPRKVTPEELKQAEDIANEIVDKDLPVTCKEMNLQEALNSGASAFFKLKYPPRVKVYTVGDESGPFSRELCGGPHVSHTAEIGHITITKEESVSGGNRRIRATIS